MARSVEILQKETYLAMIKNAAGSNLFRTLYARVNGEMKDITEDGNLSCAFFVSSILYHFGLIQSVHAGVAGLERDLQASEWREVERPAAGDVLFWEPQAQGDSVHAHCGFFLGTEEAISSRDTVRVPTTHHYTFGIQPNGIPTRAIIKMYTHNFLQKR